MFNLLLQDPKYFIDVSRKVNNQFQSVFKDGFYIGISEGYNWHTILYFNSIHFCIPQNSLLFYTTNGSYKIFTNNKLFTE